MAAVVAAALGVALLRQGPSPAERRDEVLARAEAFALALTSYDYRRVDRDLARVRALSTGGFREQYDQALGGEAFREALVANRSVATATVRVGPLLARLGEEEARTFTVLEQRITTAAEDEPQVRNVRVETVLVHTTGGWKVDRVEVT